MEIYKGIVVSGGIVAGKIWVYRGEQIHRFRQSMNIALEQLRNTYREAKEQGRTVETYFLEQIEQNFLDGDAQDMLTMKIEEENLSAEYAVVSFCEEEISQIKKDNFYEEEEKAERIAVCKETAERLLVALKQIDDSKIKFEDQVIVVANNLTFSDTERFELDKVVAFVMANGVYQKKFPSQISYSSHPFVLAKTMSIPTLANVEGLMEEDLIDFLMEGEDNPELMPINIEDFDGKYAIVDGSTGMFYVDPDEETMEKFLA